MSAAPKKSVPPKTKPEPEESSWDRIKANVRTIGGAVLLAVFIRIVLFEAFEIEGPSMQPTLLNGDRVVVAKMLYGLYLPQMHHAVLTWGGPRIGDVIIVDSPADNADIVKRVIGLEGDTIEVRDGRVWRNGDWLPQEDKGPCLEEEQQKSEYFDDENCHVYEETLEGITYTISQSSTHETPQPDQRRTTVPTGHVFVLGDHRDHSNDSRRIGPIPIRRVKGLALFIYLSTEPEAGTWLGRPRWARFFDVVR